MGSSSSSSYLGTGAPETVCQMLNRDTSPVSMIPCIDKINPNSGPSLGEYILLYISFKKSSAFERTKTTEAFLTITPVPNKAEDVTESMRKHNRIERMVRGPITALVENNINPHFFCQESVGMCSFDDIVNLVVTHFPFDAANYTTARQQREMVITALLQVLSGQSALNLSSTLAELEIKNRKENKAAAAEEEEEENEKLLVNKHTRARLMKHTKYAVGLTLTPELFRGQKLSEWIQEYAKTKPLAVAADTQWVDVVVQVLSACFALAQTKTRHTQLNLLDKSIFVTTHLAPRHTHYFYQGRLIQMSSMVHCYLHNFSHYVTEAAGENSNSDAMEFIQSFMAACDKYPVLKNTVSKQLSTALGGNTTLRTPASIMAFVEKLVLLTSSSNVRLNQYKMVMREEELIHNYTCWDNMQNLFPNLLHLSKNYLPDAAEEKDQQQQQHKETPVGVRIKRKYLAWKVFQTAVRTLHPDMAVLISDRIVTGTGLAPPPTKKSIHTWLRQNKLKAAAAAASKKKTKKEEEQKDYEAMPETLVEDEVNSSSSAPRAITLNNLIALYTKYQTRTNEELFREFVRKHEVDTEIANNTDFFGNSPAVSTLTKSNPNLLLDGVLSIELVSRSLILKTLTESVLCSAQRVDYDTQYAFQSSVIQHIRDEGLAMVMFAPKDEMDHILFGHVRLGGGAKQSKKQQQQAFSIQGRFIWTPEDKQFSNQHAIQIAADDNQARKQLAPRAAWSEDEDDDEEVAQKKRLFSLEEEN